VTFNELQVTCLRSATARQALACPNYRDRAKILLAMLFDLGKSGGHEVCSRVRTRLYCVCIANIRGFATALSGKTGATI
jgi:hypothetical protein